MSQSSSIAAVTETLRAIIAAGGYTQNVTTLPPDRSGAPGELRLNLFLYHVGIDAALRNQEFPWQGRGGGDAQAHPPPFMLPLQLHYLLTAHAEDEVAAHEALGWAMRKLHDHTQLTEREIREAAAYAGLDSDLNVQPEKVRITPLNMSADDMMKIWNAFQSPYRLSVAYEISVVLIDSENPAFSPLPVLRRGADDRGPVAVAGGGGPLITALLRGDGKRPFTTGFAGDDVIIEGLNLGPAPRVRLRRAADPDETHATVVGATRIAAGEPGGSAGTERCRLTLHAAGLPGAGPLALCLEVPDAVQPVEMVGSPPAPRQRWWHGNEVTLAIAPRISAAPAPAAPGPGAGQATITLSVEPAVVENQRAVLLLDGGEYPAQLDATAPGAPEFVIEAPTAGTYRVRLRLDGVDMPEIGQDQGQPVFAPAKTIVIP